MSQEDAKAKRFRLYLVIDTIGIILGVILLILGFFIVDVLFIIGAILLLLFISLFTMMVLYLPGRRKRERRRY